MSYFCPENRFFPKDMPHHNILYSTILVVIVSFCLFPATLRAQSETQQAVGDTLRMDSLTTETITTDVPHFYVPYVVPNAFGFYDSWALHEGINAQVGLNVSAAFGKGSPKGVGFGQQLSLAYAKPLNKRWAFAIGLTANNLDWGRYHQSSLGIAGQVYYRINERLLLYGYAVKQITPTQHHYAGAGSYGPMSPFAIFPQGDRIGVGADLKIGESMMIQVNVEAAKDTNPWENMWLHHPNAGMPPMMPYGW